MAKRFSSFLITLLLTLSFLIAGVLSVSHMCLDEMTITADSTMNHGGHDSVDETDNNSSHDEDDCGCPLHRICCSYALLTAPLIPVAYAHDILNSKEINFLNKIKPEPSLEGPFQPPRTHS